MTEKTQKLKPCPLCGCAVKWCGENEPDPEDNYPCSHIECTNAACGLDASFNHRNEIYPDDTDDMTVNELLQIDRNHAAERWNRRASQCEKE